MTLEQLNDDKRVFLFGWDGNNFNESPLVRIGKAGNDLWIWDGSDTHLVYFKDYEWNDDEPGGVSIERDGELLAFISPANDWPGVDIQAATQSIQKSRANIATQHGADFLENLIAIHKKDNLTSA